MKDFPKEIWLIACKHMYNALTREEVGKGFSGYPLYIPQKELRTLTLEIEKGYAFYDTMRGYTTLLARQYHQIIDQIDQFNQFSESDLLQPIYDRGDTYALERAPIKRFVVTSDPSLSFDDKIEACMFAEVDSEIKSQHFIHDAVPRVSEWYMLYRLKKVGGNKAVLRDLKKSSLRPATFEELLDFRSTYLDIEFDGTIYALGSSWYSHDVEEWIQWNSQGKKELRSITIGQCIPRMMYLNNTCILGYESCTNYVWSPCNTDFFLVAHDVSS